MQRVLLALAAAAAMTARTTPAHADVTRDRASAGGYLRVATRPDFQGGNSRLGYWNLYGRLLNEGNWGALELKLDLLAPQPDKRPWTNLRVKLEGGSVMTADAQNGSLTAYRASQLYVQAGNLLLEDVVWQLGTLDTYYGDLGLYDMRPAQLLFETVGLSATLRKRDFDLLVGLGDSGWSLRGPQYNTVFTAAAAARVRLSRHFEFGLGAQYFLEPEVGGNRFAPHQTPGVRYEDYVRGEVLQRFVEANPIGLDIFPIPEARESASWKAVGYAGFGGVGPVLWNSLYFSFQKRHPDQFVSETYAGRTRQIYVRDLTDERYRFDVGNELRLSVVPGFIDVAWGVLAGMHWDDDNTIRPSDDNRTFWSTVVRGQAYLTDTLHLLAETSFANETSTVGNLYRNEFDSIFASAGGAANARGLEVGDSATRTTWQGKFGPVFSPLGTGIYTRPALRLLYGTQWSSQHNAFGNSFSQTLGQYNEFPEKVSRHWHHVVALEAEAWF